VSGKTKTKTKLPHGFVQCKVCGEFNGKTSAKNLNWDGYFAGNPGGKIGVTCLCHGIPCKYCGKLKHRPISNTYDPATNTIEHEPYFSGWFGCYECEAKRREAARATAAATSGKIKC
jgi:hypothetical protein